MWPKRRKLKTITCQHCHNEFTYIYDGVGQLRRYCSEPCRHKAEIERRQPEIKAKSIFFKKLAKQRRKEGLCVACGAFAEEGSTHCWNHLRYARNYTREKRKARRLAGLCTECGAAPEPGKLYCAKHAKRYK